MEVKETKLRFKEKMPRRAALEMVLLFARHGNHHHDFDFNSDAKVKRLFEHNQVPFDALVERCREPNNAIPFFENKIGSTLTLQGGPGAKLSQIDIKTGEEKVVIQGSGVISHAAYWSLAEMVVSSRDLAIEKTSFHEYLNAIINGISSIEAYIRQKVDIWNKENPEQLLVDDKKNKVPFEVKLNNWVPIMTNGKSLRKGEKNWNDFKTILKMRDDLAVHPKFDGYGMTLVEIAENLNLIRSGIAGILIELHLCFNDRIPRTIIRMKYSPDVEVYSS